VTNLGAGFSGIAARFSAPLQVLRLILRRHQPRGWSVSR